ncbi:BCL2/adenovirus E1B 19 kDa protein-interacting protein 3 isoform X1 [Oncorhynchus keta]|uniref:BCL2/adenovirus E1B 19 kDa protein-interacting protein 3 isoform X1 n=1 Tax=Oncorhynchus keta TaxID=8018 RepID=UPI0015F92E96|nr:BCL2/adenovirus E1B 19 kDa protein-interacting protein 3 isoform X1 [Oncorhynchus keta]
MSLQKEIPYDESLQGSWVELHYNTGSGSQVCQEQISSTALDVDLEKLLLDAQHESSRSTSRGSSQCDSPLRSQTPLLLFRGSEGNSSQSEEDNQERIQEVENLLKKNADWIWDWSSRPENNPPKCIVPSNYIQEFLLKHPRRSASLSIRKTNVMKKGGVLSPDFLKLFLPSLFISHILAVGLGIYIGRRLSTYSTY